MQVQKHYLKAPITEAIIDLKVAFAESFSADKFADMQDRIQDRFPTKEPIYTGVGALADVKKIVERILRDTLADLRKLLTWNKGWNGYDACAPKYDAILNAIDWVIQFFLEVMDLDEDWLRPNVTASGEGEVVLEWRRGPKRLTIYIGEKDIEYVRAWGPDIHKDMDDGEADLIEIRQSLWKWLVVEG
jgi:hypothetical protein